ncbi:MAG: hypothetical protein NVS3B5_04790 [Sphingomicrobium sp.]
MDVTEVSGVERIASIRLNVFDIGRAVEFYGAGLGFTLEKTRASAATMSLGGEHLDLVQSPPGAALYPPERAANDPWFQHFAIRVSDMKAAYHCLLGQQPTPISVGGPQQLPPSSGSVIAYKFRDPDGHPLELSFIPGKASPAASAPLFEAIDHTALVVANLEKSLAFWVGLLGFMETGRSLNQGPTQWRLDGLAGALAEIVVLHARRGGPHLELLHYRKPTSERSALRFGPEDIAATKVRLRATAEFTASAALAQWEVPAGSAEQLLLLADPDEHLVELSM